MEENFENNIPFDLISKVISNNASAEEIKQLEAWRALSEENEKEFQNLSEIMGNVPTDVPAFNTNKAWEKVSVQTSNETIKPKVSVKNIVSIAVAAVVFAVFYFTGENTQTIIHQAKNDGEIFQLPDGSEVTLKSGSEISYSEGFKEHRAISLKGEAFFSVFRDTLHPFVISTQNAQVKVLGTSFNVREDKSKTEVVVNSGKVELKGNDHPEEKVILTKGESAIWNEKKKHIDTEVNINPTTLFYATKKLVFQRTKLSEVMKVLSMVYPNQFQLKCEAIGEEVYEGEFENKSVEEVINILEFSMEVSAEKNSNGDIIFSNEACR